MTATLQPASAPVARSRRPVPVRVTWLLVATAALVVVAAASVAFGVRSVSLDDILVGMTGTGETIAQAAVEKRVPRTVLAVLVGASLGLAGVVLQGVTRNPLADPAIIGISQGASLAIVIGLSFLGLSTATSFVWTAIVGAAVVSVFVYAIGSMGRGGATPLKLALSGAVTAAACTCLMSAILLPRVDVLDRFSFWQIGGVGGADFARIGQVLPFLAVGAALCLLSARGLNALALGDDVAAGLGAHVARTRALAALGAILLCGAATAIAGPIGFVALAVPHLCRLLVGLDHRWLLPAAALTGALLLTAADVLGRLVARPAEVDVGIVTALLGAPVFIAIVRRQRVRAL